MNCELIESLHGGNILLDDGQILLNGDQINDDEYITN